MLLTILWRFVYAVAAIVDGWGSNCISVCTHVG